MFPHATCMCMKFVKTSKHNSESRELAKHSHHQQHHHDRYNEGNNNRSENGKQFKDNSWIIRRHVDFVKISVLSPAQVSSILQQSQQQQQQPPPHWRCNKQVSRLFYSPGSKKKKKKRRDMSTEHRNEMSFDLLDVKTFENSQSFYLSICKCTNLCGRKQVKFLRRCKELKAVLFEWSTKNGTFIHTFHIDGVQKMLLLGNLFQIQAKWRERKKKFTYKYIHHILFKIPTRVNRDNVLYSLCCWA